jgi:hypothetical protein
MSTLIGSRILIAISLLALLGFSSSPAFAGSFSPAAGRGVSFSLCDASTVQDVASLDTVLPESYSSLLTSPAVCLSNLPASTSLITWNDTGYTAKYLVPESMSENVMVKPWAVKGR